VAQASKRDMSTFFAADRTPGAHTTDFTLPRRAAKRSMASLRGPGTMASALATTLA
jgi:hypothetical protein